MAKVTVKQIADRKQERLPVTMLTAYDAPFAAMIDQAGIDVILVGDSLAMVLLGLDSTVPVTMDEMIHHAKAASRGVTQALLVGDMPFLSYQVSPREAIRNAGRFLKEASCDAVKLEGGADICPTVAALVKAGIPVMGHIGLTPQTVSQLGGYRVQGRELASARTLLEAARALEDAGAFSLVLECIPDELARGITESVNMVTIGIGAGPHCDGQVLVTYDLLGMFPRKTPRFVKQYTSLAPQIATALDTFKQEVQEKKFPATEHTFSATDELRQLFT